ncbi:MAG: Maf family protein, partial [Oscillospiraceae bacterium]|nr:Maf family protein [Oscillospiraceae bacterium]
MRKLILASASPRRREILSSAGFVFDVIPSRKEEEKRGNTPEEIVMHLAEDKAMDVAQQTEKNALVLGADTIVVCEGEIMGKPKDPADAARMLLKLQGRAHQVYTGVAMTERRFGEISISSFCQKTSVFVYPMSEEEIREY